MDEQDIGLHQFFGYIVNHVPEYREAYKQFLSAESSGPADMLDGFSGFVVTAWQDRLEHPENAQRGDTFSRVSEAMEMGLRSQEDEIAGLIVACLQGHIDRHQIASELTPQLGLCTQELLEKGKQG